MVSDEACYGLSHVIDLGHLDQHWNVVEQSPIIWIIVPGNDGQATLWLKHVRGGRIINDDCIFHVSTNLSHVLDEDAVDEGAVLAKESAKTVALRVHHIHQRVSILQKITWTRLWRSTANMRRERILLILPLTKMLYK